MIFSVLGISVQIFLFGFAATAAEIDTVVPKAGETGTITLAAEEILRYEFNGAVQKAIIKKPFLKFSPDYPVHSRKDPSTVREVSEAYMYGGYSHTVKDEDTYTEKKEIVFALDKLKNLCQAFGLSDVDVAGTHLTPVSLLELDVAVASIVKSPKSGKLGIECELVSDPILDWFLSSDEFTDEQQLQVETLACKA